jgi:predicted glycosyltransferase
VKVWIDLANSPQVLFFHPIIQEIERRGHSSVITTRDFAQTEELANQYGMPHVCIGGHGGSRLSRIGLRLADRAWLLARFASRNRCDLAVSHNSYAQIAAASGLGIQSVTLMDYEHQPANHLAFRLARRVIVPEHFPDEALRRYGARPRKTRRYRGVKEQIYLAGFKPRAKYLESIGIDPARIVVVMRPPGAWGLYHDFENPLFNAVFKHVAVHREATIVLLPRVPSQADAARAAGFANVVVADGALDGPNLLYHADLAISGGGTMNREAAVLGTPAFSVFKGTSPAVDRYLIAQGRMTQVAGESDIARIAIRKKQTHDTMQDAALVGDVADAILDGGET